jgi:HAD superfamily hydrolase (TIGR01490 family)
LQFARAAYHAGLVTRAQIARDAVRHLRFRLRGSTDAATTEVRARVAEAITGARVRDLQRLAPEALGRILPRVYPRMLELAWSHQDDGRPIYICTAAGQELADVMASVLFFDGAVGSRSEVVGGVYTGRPGGPFTYGEGKAQAIRELAAAQGIDLAASWGYSDSASDLPMLRAVGHPVAVNPDAELADVGRAEGWEVMRFETLGRRLKLAGTAVAAGAIGTAGGWIARRRAAAARGPLRRALRRR